MGSIIDRLQQLIAAYGLNNNSLTVKAGLSVGLIAQSIKSGKGLHSDTIQKILNTFPEVSAEWFVMGRGTMLRDGPALAVAAEPGANYGQSKEDIIEAAREAARIAAREEFEALARRKRTSPVAVVASTNCGGAPPKES